MTATESLLPKVINDFCNKICTTRTCQHGSLMSAFGGGADIISVDGLTPSRHEAGCDPVAQQLLTDPRQSVMLPCWLGPARRSKCSGECCLRSKSWLEWP